MSATSAILHPIGRQSKCLNYEAATNASNLTTNNRTPLATATNSNIWVWHATSQQHIKHNTHASVVLRSVWRSPTLYPLIFFFLLYLLFAWVLFLLQALPLNGSTADFNGDTATNLNCSANESMCNRKKCLLPFLPLLLLLLLTALLLFVVVQPKLRFMAN